MKRFLVVLRYDIEDISLNPATGLPELYSRSLECWDQTPLLSRLNEVLRRHQARASFAVSYALLKRGLDTFGPLPAAEHGHLFTWHLHLRWDPSVQRDWGPRVLPSCYIGHYKGAALERLLDMADGVFAKAFGHVPKVNLNACLCASEELLQSLERRGYLVQGDYTANTDYRVMEKLLKYRFHGGRPFQGGPGAPCYPYAPDQPYRPHRNAGMLMGDMKLIVVPITQLSPGMGLPHQDTYQIPDLEIKMIDELYRRSDDLTVLVLAMHPHSIMMGPGSAEANADRNLACFERVLDHLETLDGMQYATYLDVHRHYCAAESRSTGAAPVIRDVGNGFLAYNGVNSLKYQSVGVGKPFLYSDPLFDPVSLAVGQDNGIAEWLINGQDFLGPAPPAKAANRTYRRKALATTEVCLGSRDLRLPRRNAEASVSRDAAGLGFHAACTAAGLRVETRYCLNNEMDTLALQTTVHGERASSARVEHHYALNPRFRIEQRDPGCILLSAGSVKCRITSEHGFRRVARTKEAYVVKAQADAGRCTTRLEVLIQASRACLGHSARAPSEHR